MPRLTRSDKAAMREALHYAIKWQESVVDSVVGCTDPSFVQQRTDAQAAIEQYKKLKAHPSLQNSR